MRRDILILLVLGIFYMFVTWFFLFGFLLGVKRTKRVVERHPYFSFKYPWYKRLFYLGLNKHKYLTVFAFMIHGTQFLFYVLHLIDYFIFKKITLLSRIGAGFILLNLVLMGLMGNIVLKNQKKGWKFNK